MPAELLGTHVEGGAGTERVVEKEECNRLSLKSITVGRGLESACLVHH
jgi:hypothetical protein